LCFEQSKTICSVVVECIFSRLLLWLSCRFMRPGSELFYCRGLSWTLYCELAPDPGGDGDTSPGDYESVLSPEGLPDFL
jgi:hypothetical protein